MNKQLPKVLASHLFSNLRSGLKGYFPPFFLTTDHQLFPSLKTSESNKKFKNMLFRLMRDTIFQNELLYLLNYIIIIIIVITAPVGA